jgi:hypothetical protein
MIYIGNPFNSYATFPFYLVTKIYTLPSITKGSSIPTSTHNQSAHSLLANYSYIYKLGETWVLQSPPP